MPSALQLRLLALIERLGRMTFLPGEKLRRFRDVQQQQITTRITSMASIRSPAHAAAVKIVVVIVKKGSPVGSGLAGVGGGGP